MVDQKNSFTPLTAPGGSPKGRRGGSQVLLSKDHSRMKKEPEQRREEKPLAFSML